MYKHGRGVELGSTEKQLQLAARAGFEPWDTGLKSSALNHSAMLPSSILEIISQSRTSSKQIKVILHEVPT